MQNRTRFIAFIFTIFGLLIISRVYYLSIKSHEEYKFAALENTTKTEPIAPVRGIIKDRNSYPLAVNEQGFAIAIKPHLSKKSRCMILEEELKFIEENLFDQDRKKLEKIYKKRDSPYSHNFVKVIDFLSFQEVQTIYTQFNIRENLKIIPAYKRYYPYENLASHIIGYVSKANEKDVKRDPLTKLTGYFGKDALERSYNKTLQGKAGFKKTKVNAYNEEIEIIEVQEPTSSSLILSLDIQLQEYISRLFEGRSGVVIVMEANTGAILSAVSNPEYNLNDFVSGMSVAKWKELSSDFNHPFTNKIINGKYPPGSVIKMGVALSFLNSGIFNEKKSFYCSGKIKVGNRKFRCWKKHGHGSVDTVRAIRESCDVYFYEGALLTGINNIAKHLRRYGLGRKTGVDLYYESKAVVPDKAWKRKRYNKSWFRGETVVSTIGQGYFLVTPLQIAKYTAFLATGKEVTPHFAEYIDNTKTHFPTKNILNDLEKTKIEIIRKGMWQVANHPRGTAYWGTKGIKVEIAGKTGTAQVVGIPQSEKTRMKEEQLEYYHRSHAWLTTYGPFKDPKYVVTVLVEHGGHGGSAAGDIVKDIFNMLKTLRYIKD